MTWISLDVPVSNLFFLPPNPPVGNFAGVSIASSPSQLDPGCLKARKTERAISLFYAGSGALRKNRLIKLIRSEEEASEQFKLALLFCQHVFGSIMKFRLHSILMMVSLFSLAPVSHAALKLLNTNAFEITSGAGSDLLANGSFETPGLALTEDFLGVGQNQVQGWVLRLGVGGVRSSNYYARSTPVSPPSVPYIPFAFDGEFLVMLDSTQTSDSADPGNSATTTVQVEAGQEYLLRFAINTEVGETKGGVAGIFVSMSGDFTMGPTLFKATNPADVPREQAKWTVYSLPFTPSVSGTVTIRFQEDGIISGNSNVSLDGVTVSTIPNIIILEDADLQEISISGITSAGGAVSLTATAETPGLFAQTFADYQSPNTTGKIFFRPLPNTFGKGIINVTAREGQVQKGGQFSVTVLKVNDKPTLDPIPDLTLLENPPAQVVPITGITSGSVDELDFMVVTATSDNPSLIPNSSIQVNYTSPNRNGTLTFQPIPGVSGVARITVKVKDNGGTLNGGEDTETRVFLVTVTGVNKPPTLDFIPDLSLLEDAPQQTVTLTRISSGAPTENQTLTVNAVSDNPLLISTPRVTYVSPSATATLRFTPLPNAVGTATITVTTQDDGGTANGGINTTIKSFKVTVVPVNDQPTLTEIPSLTVLENSLARTLFFRDVRSGAAETQTLTVTATSDNPSLIPDPGVSYVSPNRTGSLTFKPATNAIGVAVITVTVRDDGGTDNGGIDTISRQFSITVAPVDKPPTIDAITNLTLLEDAVQQVVNLTGISAGSTKEAQVISITATSDNPALILDPSISYVSPSTNGTLVFQPLPNAHGSASITVSVSDSITTLTRTFTVTVLPVNDAPTLDPISNSTIPGNAPEQVVLLSGITSGVPNELQNLIVTATSDNKSVIPDPNISYTSPNTNGILTFQPLAGTSGTVTISVTVTDDGGTTNGGINSFTRQFTVTVSGSPSNNPPTLDPISSLTVLENSGPRTVFFRGVRAGTDENQMLTVTAVSDTPSLIPDPAVSYVSPNRTGSLLFKPATNSFGVAIITVTVKDDGGTNNGGIDTFSRQFSVTVTPLNRAPTIDVITNITILEDSPLQKVTLAGISSGATNEAQVLTVTAVSDNPGLIPDPLLTYLSPTPNGTLAFQPLPNVHGIANITVTVLDDGSILNGGTNAVVRRFSITVVPVNDAPTLDVIPDISISENAPVQIVNLSGISSGVSNELQVLMVTAVSDRPVLIPNPLVTYISPSSNGVLRLQPLAGASGVATITVTVTDDGTTTNGGSNSFTRQFRVTVSAAPANNPPTLNPIPDLTVAEDALEQVMNLSGIGAGPGGSNQNLTIGAVSSQPGLIPHPTVNYSSPATNGTLSFKPSGNQHGTAVITVTVKDDGGTNNLGRDTFTRQFTVTVTPVNDAPTLNPISDITILENAPAQTVNLSGIGSGATNELQMLTVTATSDRPGLVPNPIVTYTRSGATGSLSLQPLPGAVGVAIISVTVKDNGGTNGVDRDAITRQFTVTVTPVNDQPSVTITSPQNGSTFIGPTNITISASANDPDGSVVKVEFFEDGTKLGEDSTIPYSLAWDAAMGVHVLTARVTDNEGAVAGSAPVTVTINESTNRPPTGDILIIRNAVDSEVDLLVNYLKELRIPEGASEREPDVLVLDRNGLSFDFIRGFRLIIWNDLGRSVNPITAPEVEMFRQLKAAGIPLFLIGEHLAGSTSTLGTAASAWRDLTHLALVDGSINSALVEPTNNRARHPLFRSRYGTVTAFQYPVALEKSSLSGTNFDLAMIANGNPVMVQSPTFQEPDYGQARVLSQNFRVSGGADEVSIEERKQLFQNGVGWLLRVTDCNNFGLNVICEDAPVTGRVGEPIVFSEAVTQNGECTLGGVLLTNLLSPGLELVSFELIPIGDLADPSTVRQEVIGNALVSRFADLGRGKSFRITITAIPRKGGTFLNKATLNYGALSFFCEQAVQVEGGNEAPTLNPIPDLTIPENSPEQVVLLSGITSGDPDKQQVLAVSASSDRPGVVPIPAVSYTGPNSTGSIRFRPVVGTNGTAIITVTIRDNGGTANGGVDTFTRQFRVTVTPSGGGCSGANVILKSVMETGGSISLIVQGETSCRTFLEKSDNLLTWITDREVQPTPAGTKISLGKPGTAIAYYRLVFQP